MKFSIRHFLLFNILFTLLLSSFLIGIANYYIDERDINEHLSLIGLTGYSDTKKGNEVCRILLSTDNPSSGLQVAGMDRPTISNTLARHVAMDDLIILLCVFPISGLLVWLIVNKGLSSILRVTKEVAQRDPRHLEPVEIQNVPMEIKPLVRELNRLFERLNEAFEREYRFSADAAHELRTPLAALKVGAQVALITKDEVEKNKAIEKLIETLDRSIHIVQQLLTMSKLTPDMYGKTQFKEFDLLTAVKDIIGIMVPVADKKNIELSLESTNSVWLKGDETAINILMRNLIDNAIRYSEANTNVVIRLIKQADRIGVEVRDQGPGIPDSLKLRVLERFYRIIGSKEAGSGLGLGIVQQICDIHHAKIEFVNSQEKGLIVRVWFPID